MKRITRSFSILAIAAIFLSGCKEPKAAVAPEPDTEVQSALDVAWATYVISDIEQICAFMGENDLHNHFYTYIPGSASASSGTVFVHRDVQAKYLRMAFNDTKSVDGRFRQGTVFMNYEFDPLRKQGANPNSEYYDEYGFSGQITLSNYRVDGWKVELYPFPTPASPYPAYVYNELVSNQWNPKVTNLVWQIAGKFLFTHPSDSSRNLVWEGKLFKTLLNTSDPLVYNPARLTPISFSLAEVSYYGTVSGFQNSKLTINQWDYDNVTKLPEAEVKAKTVPYSMEIGQNNPLIRDFKCFPYKIGGVATTSTANVLGQRLEEHHPFIKGIASYTTGDKYPRQIYFGNEGNPDLAQQCDNVGEIMIKGISYRVNFMK